MGDKLIWSKRYSEAEEFRYIEKLCEKFAGRSDETSSSKNEISDDPMISKEEANKIIKSFTDSITRIPVEQRLVNSRQFIAETKRFSQAHRVSADIYRGPSSVSVWLYFNAEVLTGDKKNDFVALLNKADEISGVTYPNGMSDWCEYAVILYFMTHRSYVEGRELHPFDR